MQQPPRARRRFAELIRRPDPQVPLAEAALALAWEDQGGPDPRAALAQLDSSAAQAQTAVQLATTPQARVAALSAVLFEQLGFHGDPGCYQQPDPANSYLDRVIERRTGLPIMLSLIYLESGWRLGLPLYGLALPGHFLVRLADTTGDLYIDPLGAFCMEPLSDMEHTLNRMSLLGRIAIAVLRGS